MLLLLSAAAVYLGIRFRRFAFVAYGTLYGYAGLTIRALDAMGDATAGLLWLVVTGSLIVFALVRVAQRFGRDE